MGRWVAALIALGVLALLGGRWWIQPHREAYTVVGTARDGTVLHLRYAVGNTGVFGRQLTTRVAILRDDLHPLEHRAISGQATVDDQGVHGGSDRLERRTGGWAFTVTGSGMRVQGDVSENGDCPPRPGRLRVLANVPGGSTELADGDFYEGTGFVVRTLARGNVRGGALYAAAAGGALAIDPLASCPAWIHAAGAATAGTVALVPTTERSFALALAGHRVAVTVGPRHVIQRALDHTLAAERLMAWAVGFRSPVLVLRRVRVTVDDHPERWPGVLVTREVE